MLVDWLLSRRQFVGRLVAAPWLPGCRFLWASPSTDRVHGPGARYRARVRAAFVRRREDYGIRWPGAIYDGQAARRNYTRQLQAAAQELAMDVDLRSEPIYSETEGSQWVSEAVKAGADGLVVLLLDRQEHSWPVAVRAAESGLPTVIFAPIGTAFTTNTERLANRPGVFIASTDDFRQVAFGLKMLKAGAWLREMRFVVIQGKERRDARVPHIGTHLRYVPARVFIEEYERTPVDEEVRTIASQYVQSATDIRGPSEKDILNGVRSYVVARGILEREDGDGITMDCLGALGPTQISLPCIAWSYMLDRGIPAACEADIGAALTHALVQKLFDRPGFQQDPVPETARQCLIGAHCTCPTRLRGWNEPPEPYYLSHHHGRRDAVPVPQWSTGQRVTIADLILGDRPEVPPRLLVSTGTVIGNVAVPPAGGCVVSVMVELDGHPSLLDYPGFHQIFFYGDFRRELVAFARLFRIEPVTI